MMNTNKAKAPRASSKSKSMSLTSISGWLHGCAAAVILGGMAACSTPPSLPLLPLAKPAARTPALDNSLRQRDILLRENSRWIPVEWGELPGWGQDSAVEVWPALLRGCNKPAAGWAEVCALAFMAAPADDVEAALWLMQHLQPYRVESLGGDAQGLITGYYEPLLQASRKPQTGFTVPVHGAPADLNQRRPYYTRQQIETEQRLRLRGDELAYLESPVDLALLQVQGSGRMNIVDAAGGEQLLRLAFAGHNDQPYQSVGRALIERGDLRPGQASWPAIRDWAKRNPQRAPELLWTNPRYVFFREEAMPDAELGPRGAQGVPLTPGRSIAVDRASIPYGTPVWLDATEPLSKQPLRRLVMAQDTGSAIMGAVRADYFWGWGAQAEAQAGRMKQPLRLWALWPMAPLQTASTR